MRKKRIIIFTALLPGILIVFLLFFRGCSLMSGVGQQKGPAETNSESKQTEIKTEKGAFAVSAEGKSQIPKNFPQDVFVFPDAQPLVAYVGNEGDKIFSLNYLTEISVSEALNRCKEELKKSGWEMGLETSLGADKGVLLSYKKTAENRKIIFTIGKDTSRNSGKTYISLNGVNLNNNNNDNTPSN